MTTFPRLFLLLTACAVSSACGLFFDTDALRQPGTTGGGGNGGNGGGPGGGAAGPTMNGGGGNGDGGFGGSVDPIGCDAPGYCGPSSSCEPDGFCSVVSTEAPEGVVGVAFVRGSSEGQNVEHVAVHSSSEFSSAHRLSVWPLGFEQGESYLPGTAQLDDPGVGFIAAGGPDHVYYFGQLQSCDVDVVQDSCVTVCSIGAAGIDCFPTRILTGGAQVNGAAMVPSNDPSLDRLYFVESNDASNERLQRVSRNCLETNQQDCPAQLAANYDAPDALDPLGLDLDPTDGSLWWNTWGGAGAPGACVYHYPSPAGDIVPCVPTAPPIDNPNRLAVSGASVFVGTFDPDGAAGPIQRISRCNAGNAPHPVTEFSNVTWPADADSNFLYATTLDTSAALQVIDANTGNVLKTLFVEDGSPITTVDASNPYYLLFAAGQRIFRWRKPPSPCADPSSEPACGNGCVEAGESCDDGNDNPNDGCNACQCATP
jgi:cysteine-rich repeat protein